jgi:hypothetical protein
MTIASGSAGDVMAWRGKKLRSLRSARVDVQKALRWESLKGKLMDLAM